MTVSAQVPFNNSTAAPGATLFTYGFKIIAAADLLVMVDGVEKTLGVDYTVSGVGADLGGDVTFVVPMIGGEQVLRKSNMAYVRETDYQNLGDLHSSTLNNDQDAPVLMIRQLAGEFAKTVQVPDALLGIFNATLPYPIVAGRPLWLNFAGTGFEYGDPTLTGDMLLRPNLAADSGAALVVFKQAGTGSQSRTVLDKLQDAKSAFDYMSTAQIADVRNRTASIDVSAAINAALSANTTVFLPAGTYRMASPALLVSTKKLIGEGRESTILTSPTNNQPVVRVQAFSPDFLIADMTVRHSVTPIAGGDGIDCSAQTGLSTIRNVYSIGNWIGFHLGTCDYNVMDNCLAVQNYSHGVRLSNQASAGNCQWYLSNTLAQANNGDGFRIDGSTSQMSCGGFSRCATFANTGWGMRFLGSAINKIFSVRISDCFIGEDGAGEIYMDTYADTHKITDTFIELSGSRTTGVGLATAASNVGPGLQMTANNTNVAVNNCEFINNAYTGIQDASLGATINNCRITGNGRAAAGGQTYGIRTTGATGLTKIQGCTIGNVSGSVYQTIGVYTAADNTMLIGNDLNGNTVLGFTSDVVNVVSTILGNQPTSVGSLHPNALLGFTAGGIAAGPGMTQLGAGSINVQDRVAKNGTTYTNP